MIKVKVRGSFKKTERFLQKMLRGDQYRALERFGPLGVAALASATPRESSQTANSWTYSVVKERGFYTIVWRNTHIDGGAPVAILLQYGHGTKNGGHVEGKDYINPAMRPIFDQMAADMWKVVTK